MDSKKKLASRMRRKRRVRKKLSGTTTRPRMTVFRSNKHIYVQVVDDVQGVTLAAASTLSPEIREEVKGLKKVEQAQKVGALCAQRCTAKSIDTIIFDRNGFDYTGRVQAIADAARKAGLKF